MESMDVDNQPKAHERTEKLSESNGSPIPGLERANDPLDDHQHQEETDITDLQGNPAETRTWLKLLRKVSEEPDIIKRRPMWEALVSQYPLSSKIWTRYADQELKLALANEDEEFEYLKTVFRRSLLLVCSVTLWHVYVKYLLANKKLTENDIEKGFELSIENVGFHYNSTDIWLEYLNFLKKQVKNSAERLEVTRKAFFKAFSVPLRGLKEVWASYDQFEPRPEKKAEAKGVMESSNEEANVRGRLWRGLMTENLPEKQKISSPENQRQITQWMEVVKYEATRFVYLQAIGSQTYCLELWILFFNSTVLKTKSDRLEILNLAKKYLPESIVLGVLFVQNFPELSDQVEEVFRNLLRLHKTLADRETIYIFLLVHVYKENGVKSVQEVFHVANDELEKQNYLATRLFQKAAKLVNTQKFWDSLVEKTLTAFSTNSKMQSQIEDVTSFSEDYILYCEAKGDQAKLIEALESVLSLDGVAERSMKIWEIYLNFAMLNDSKLLQKVKEKYAFKYKQNTNLQNLVSSGFNVFDGLVSSSQLESSISNFFDAEFISRTKQTVKLQSAPMPAPRISAQKQKNDQKPQVPTFLEKLHERLVEKNLDERIKLNITVVNLLKSIQRFDLATIPLDQQVFPDKQNNIKMSDGPDIFARRQQMEN
eukprot:snap_masked-scaffold_2-processed-gene-10.30-mRNA-1 protein AED:1.00 eAED:1.00 QI:0/-1/0/0/-1/1/1/0/653